MAYVGMNWRHHLHTQGKPRHCSNLDCNLFSYFFQEGEVVINLFAILILPSLLFTYISFEIMRVGGDNPQFGLTFSTRFFVDLSNLKRRKVHLC